MPEATVLSVTENSVSFRSGRSIVNVPINQLSTDLRERAYLQIKVAPPYNPAAQRASAPAGRPQPREREPTSPSPSGQSPPDDLSSIRNFAYNEAVRYFRYEYQAGSGESYSRGISINSCEPIVGWDGQYRAEGSAQVIQYDSYTSESRRKVSFEMVIARSPGGGLTRQSFTTK